MTQSDERRGSGAGTAPAPLPLIDSHAHLDDPAFDVDRAAVLAATFAAGITTIVNVGYCPERWETTRALAAAEPRVVAALGLHPAHAAEWSDALGERLRAAAGQGAVAIGEVGIDLYRDGPSLDRQREAFSAQLDLALSINLPVIVHQRAAEQELLALLAARDRSPPLLFHSFEGSDRLARFAVERGCFVGVGGLAIKPSAGDLRRVLSRVPMERILLETDAPYLPPAESGARRNTPANLPVIADRAAPIWGTTAEELAARTTATTRAFFSLDHGTASKGMA